MLTTEQLKAPWERSPREVKTVLDRIFCTGVNRTNWHTYDSSPDEFGFPGIAYFAGMHLNRKVTWWKESRAFITYTNRSHLTDVTNLWINRLIGDQKLPPEQRKTYSNVVSHKKAGRLRSRDADKYPRVSGLIGPVKIRFSRVYTIEN